MSTTMTDVFLSHASDDAALANRLAVFLEACGVKCFMASLHWRWGPTPSAN